MRLSKNQILAILTAKELFFSDSKIYLFGSRIDHSKTGGDIDLYILSKNRVVDSIKKRIEFLVFLKSLIGDQKIDVILADQSQNRLIDKIVKKEGILIQSSDMLDGDSE